LYILLLWWFDHHLWKVRLVRAVLQIKVPDLSGKWDGEIHARTPSGDVTLTFVAHIAQTWFRIRVYCEFERSKSYSQVLAIDNEAPKLEIRYIYRNETKTSADPDMKDHEGTVTLIQQDEGLLVGDYYNKAPQRLSYGEMRLRRT
jgi:hypothetical protein